MYKKKALDLKKDNFLSVLNEKGISSIVELINKVFAEGNSEVVIGANKCHVYRKVNDYRTNQTIYDADQCYAKEDFTNLVDTLIHKEEIAAGISTLEDESLLVLFEDYNVCIHPKEDTFAFTVRFPK